MAAPLWNLTPCEARNVALLASSANSKLFREGRDGRTTGPLEVLDQCIVQRHQEIVGRGAAPSCSCGSSQRDRDAGVPAQHHLALRLDFGRICRGGRRRTRHSPTHKGDNERRDQQAVP